jgi:adenine deaminase
MSDMVSDYGLEGLDQSGMRSRMEVALGETPADLSIINARVVNVYTQELTDKCSIFVKGAWIVHMGTDSVKRIGSQTRVIDAAGRTVIPGLIDGHTHMAWLCSPYAFLKQAMPSGTTTIITETLEPYPISGLAGVQDFLAALKGQPIKIFATAPAMVSTSSRNRCIAPKDLAAILEDNSILGLGESYWQGVIQEPDRFIPVLSQTLAAGKRLEGHSAGAKTGRLSAYAGLGISSCHEPITAQETLARLRLGMWVMAREGSIRRDLKSISAIKDEGIDLRRLIIASDGVSPRELLEYGYMDGIVQRAIDCGFDPITAIQMATLNVAEHFRIDHFTGGIAPGRHADMVIIPDPEHIVPQTVISRGEIIFSDSSLLVQPRRHEFSIHSKNSIHLPHKFEAADFTIKGPDTPNRPDVPVRVIEMVTDLVTRESQQVLPLLNGEIDMARERDIIKVTAIDRTHAPGRTFTGLIQGLGLRAGAVACSAAWDTSDIIVAGAEENDMALAVNHLNQINGGAVVCKDQRIVAELAMPVFGLMSELPVKKLADKLRILNNKLNNLGIPFPDPLLSLVTLTGAAIPFLRICEEGLFDFKSGKTLDLFLRS